MSKTLTLRAEGRSNNGLWIPGKKVIGRIEVDGSPVGGDSINPTSARGRKKLELEDALLMPLIDRAMTTGETQTYTWPDEISTRAGTLMITVRNFDSTESVTAPYTPEEALRLLATVAVTKLFCWKDTDLLAVVDVDYHDCPAPERIHLTTWVETMLTPRPAAWHFSRGDGLHLAYTASGIYSALELAACAALRFRMIDGSAGLELKTQVRGPGAEPLIIQPQLTTGTLSTWLGVGNEVDEEAVKDWLDSNNMEVGGRYDHTFCPIDGGTSPGERNPVTVTPHGIYCFRCQGKGLVMGSRTPGFASFSALTKTPASSDVGFMVKNMTHWGHAKWVLGYKYNLPLELARPAYLAACKAAHEGDERVESICHPDTDDLARVGSEWKNLTSGYSYPAVSLKPLIACLPAAQDPDGKPRSSTVAYLSQGHDLDRRGYANLNVINGFSLSKQFLPTPPQALVSVLQKEVREQGAPRYVTGVTQESEEAAWAVLERLVPGIDRIAVKALICATGCAQETRLGMAPMLFFAGGTGVAKTSTGIFAMGILGTKATAVQYHAQDERLKQSIKEAAVSSGLVVANEFLKDAMRMLKRNDPQAAFDSLLTMTPDTQSHVMYVGSRTLGRIPGIVITEPHLPVQIAEYRQIARRFRYRILHGEKTTWGETFAQIGLGVDQGHLFRMKDKVLADAADVILSSIINQFFSSPLTWDNMADTLGVYKIQDHPDLPDSTDRLLEFFKEVCAAPEISDARLRRKHVAGYKKITRNDTQSDQEERLHDLYADFSDAADWHMSKLLNEKDWAALVGSAEPVSFDLRGDGAGSVFVRFRTGPARFPKGVNDQIPCKVLADAKNAVLV